MPLWFSSATVSVVSTSWPAIDAPTSQVSHSSVSCADRLVTPVMLNRLARFVPGPENPGVVELVVEVRTTRPGLRSSWPVEKEPGKGATLLCPAGPVSWNPLNPDCARPPGPPGKSISMSTNQPLPSIPALLCRSGAKTSIFTGFLSPLSAEALACTADAVGSGSGVAADAAPADPMTSAAAAAAANAPTAYLL